MDWRGFSANKHTPGVAIPSLWLWLRCCAFRQRWEGKKLIADGWSGGGFQIYSYLFPFFSSTKTSFNRSRFYLLSLLSAPYSLLSQMRKRLEWKKMCEMKIPFRYQTSFITGRRVRLGFGSRVTVELSLSVILHGFVHWRHKSNAF